MSACTCSAWAAAGPWGRCIAHVHGQRHGRLHGQRQALGHLAPHVPVPPSARQIDLPLQQLGCLTQADALPAPLPGPLPAFRSHMPAHPACPPCLLAGRYAWVALLHVVGGLSFPTTLRLASTLAAAWLATFHILLDRQQLRPAAMWRHDSDSFGEARAGAAAGGDDDTASEVHAGFGGGGGGDGAGGGSVQAWAAEGSSTGGAEERQRLLLATAADSTGGGGPWGGQAATGHGGSSAWDSGQHGWEQDGKAAAAAAELWHVEEGAMPKGSQARQRMSWRERLQRTAALWPYMVPLCTVYFAE